MNTKTQIAIILFKVGLIIIVSGLIVGLAFGQWTLILIFGLMFMLPNMIEQVVIHFRDYVSQHTLRTE